MRFWLKILRFAYRRLPEDDDHEGIPGKRSKADPCEEYSPRNRQRYTGRCDGDGHYLCRECKHLNEPMEEADA